MRMPAEITRKISERAVAIAKNLAPRKTGKGAEALKSTSQEGEIGIVIPDEVFYMKYQNDGTQPHIQRELIGRTIPIRNANGTISFRRATEANVGRMKIVSRNERGQILTTKIGWRHPGIEGSHFIEKSLRQAVSEWAQTSSGQEMIKVLEDSDVSYLMDILRGRD